MQTTLSNTAIAIVVAVLIIARQFSARRFGPAGGGARRFVLPLALAVLALREPHLVDPAHHDASVALLVAGVLVTALFACGLGFTTRVWREPDGSIWTKGTPGAVGIWVIMVATRLGLYALGSSMGVSTGTGGILLSLAAMVLVRGLVVGRRARALEASYGVPAAN